MKLVLDDAGEFENVGKKLGEARECYDILFQEDIRHNRRQYDGTPLLWAVEHVNVTLVDKLLVYHIIDPNSEGSKAGRAALSYAAENGQETIAQQLSTMGKTEVDLRMFLR